MAALIFRQAIFEDIATLAEIKAINSGTKAYWQDRIDGYMQGLVNPQKALAPRVLFVAVEADKIVAFVAGHLTTRYDCDGELQWIDTIEAYRRKGIASKLVKTLNNWFVQQKAFKICVDPGNPIAREFYKNNGAIDLNAHWMYWPDITSLK